MTQNADSVTRGGGCDRRLTTAPPGPDYRQVGWHCIYHEQAGRSCHNPLDCDFIPLWALTVDEAKRRIKAGSTVRKSA